MARRRLSPRLERELVVPDLDAVLAELLGDGTHQGVLVLARVADVHVEQHAAPRCQVTARLRLGFTLPCVAPAARRGLRHRPTANTGPPRAGRTARRRTPRCSSPRSRRPPCASIVMVARISFPRLPPTVVIIRTTALRRRGRGRSCWAHS